MLCLSKVIVLQLMSRRCVQQEESGVAPEVMGSLFLRVLAV